MLVRKIVVISPSSFPGTSGDTSNYLELLRGIKCKKADVMLICPFHPQGRKFDKKMKKEGIMTVRVPFNPPRLKELEPGKTVPLALKLAIFCVVELLATLFVLLKNNARFVVIRHSILTFHLAPLLAMLRIRSIADGETPINLSVCGSNVPRVIVRFLKVFEQKLLGFYTFYLASTSSQLPLLNRVGFPRSRTILRNIGIDTSKVPVHNLAEIPKGTFGFFGSLEEWQDPEILIRSWAKLPDKNPNLRARLFIIGNGSKKIFLQELARDLGVADKISFCDGVPREILWNKYFKLFRVAIISRSSTVYSENASIKLVEALAAGKPIIATSVPGILAMVKDEDGIILVDPDDINSMSNAVLKLTNDDSPLFELSKRALRASRRFKIDVQSDGLLRVLGLS